MTAVTRPKMKAHTPVLRCPVGNQRSEILTVRWSFIRTTSLFPKIGPRWPLMFWLRSTSEKRVCRSSTTRVTPCSTRRATRYSVEKTTADRSLVGWLDAGLTGDTKMVTSIPPKMHARSTMRSVTCLPHRCAHPTHHNGSTPVCTGPTVSMGLRRGTSSSIQLPVRSPAPIAPISALNHTPVSSRASRTTWSARVESWISGREKHASSSTDPAPDPTSPHCAERENRSLEVASPRD